MVILKEESFGFKMTMLCVSVFAALMIFIMWGIGISHAAGEQVSVDGAPIYLDDTMYSLKFASAGYGSAAAFKADWPGQVYFLGYRNGTSTLATCWFPTLDPAVGSAYVNRGIYLQAGPEGGADAANPNNIDTASAKSCWDGDDWTTLDFNSNTVIKKEPFDEVFLTNTDIYNRTGFPNPANLDLTDYGLGVIAPSALVIGPNFDQYQTPFSLVPDDTTLLENEVVTFTLSGGTGSFNTIFIWEDVGDLTAEEDPAFIIYDVQDHVLPYEIDWAFENQGAYTFTVMLANDCQSIDYTSCNDTNFVSSEEVTVTQDPVNSNEFRTDKWELFMGEDVTFSYNINEDTCSDFALGSFSGAQLLVGLPFNEQVPIELETLSGSYVYTYETRGHNNGQVRPFIRILCSEGSDPLLDLNSELNSPTAWIIHVKDPSQAEVPPDESQFYHETGENTFIDGSGNTIRLEFFSNVAAGPIGTNVWFGYSLGVPFTEDETVFFEDINTATGVVLPDQSNGFLKYFNHTYTSSGYKLPYLLVKSDFYDSEDESSFYTVFLGGEIEAVLGGKIRIFGDGETGEEFLPISTGIFGFACPQIPMHDVPLVFKPFMVAGNYLLKGICWFGAKAFQIAYSLPVFSTIEEILLPVDGEVVTWPDSLLGQTGTGEVIGPIIGIFGATPGSSVVIDLVDPESDQAWFFDFMLRLILFVSVFRYILKRVT